MISTWKKITDAHIANISQLLANLRIVAHDYDKTKRHISDIGFNIFRLTSDIIIVKTIIQMLSRHFLIPRKNITKNRCSYNYS